MVHIYVPGPDVAPISVASFNLQKFNSKIVKDVMYDAIFEHRGTISYVLHHCLRFLEAGPYKVKDHFPSFRLVSEREALDGEDEGGADFFEGHEDDGDVFGRNNFEVDQVLRLLQSEARD